MPWLIVKCRPQHEGIAQRQIERFEQTTYLPKFFDVERHCKRLLFISYIFLKHVMDNWAFLHQCSGVLYLLRDPGGSPGMLPDKFIEGLQRKHDRNGLVVLPKPPELKQGDRVRVRYGSAAGYTGIYEGQRPHDRVAIMLGSVEFTVPRKAIEALSQST